MGAASKAFVQKTIASVGTAKANVKELVDAIAGLTTATPIYIKYLTQVEAITKNNPAHDIASLEKSIPELRKLRTVCEAQGERIQDCSHKIDEGYHAARLSIAGAKKVIEEFSAHCTEKATHWNPLRKKSLSGNLKIIAKARSDMGTIEKNFEMFEAAAKQYGMLS